MTKAQLAYYARSYLWAFPKLASGNKNPKHIKYIATRIQEAIERAPECKKKQLIIISGPPRHGKSEIVSIHTPPWILGNYPKKRIIMACYAASLSQKHSAQARDIFEKWGPILWNQHPSPKVFSREAWDTTQGGGVKAGGLSTGTTGFGADLLIVDDYHSDPKEAESQLLRDDVWNWWESVAATRLHPRAVVVIFAARWHDDDLIGRLLKQIEEKGDNFPFEVEIIKLPALAEKDDILGREEGEALWRWWSDEQDLEYTKDIVGPYTWSALFQGNPTPRGGTLFLKDNFRYWYIEGTTGDILCIRKEKPPIRIKKNELLITHAYIDPAIEEKKSSCPTGMAAWSYSKNNRVWLLRDVRVEQIPHDKISYAALTFAFKNNCSKIGCENEKLGKVMVKQSAGEDKIGDIKIPFVEVAIGKLDKYARATPMANYMGNERVFFKKGAPWLADYEKWLVDFPRGKIKEAADITSMADEMETKMTVAEALRSRRN